MNPIRDSYGYYSAPYVHSWPGQVKTRNGCKYSKARKAAFKAKHA